MFYTISYFLENGDSYFLKPIDNPMEIFKKNMKNSKKNGAIMRILVPDEYVDMNYDGYMHEVYMFKNWLITGVQAISNTSNIEERGHDMIFEKF